IGSMYEIDILRRSAMEILRLIRPSGRPPLELIPILTLPIPPLLSRFQVRPTASYHTYKNRSQTYEPDFHGARGTDILPGTQWVSVCILDDEQRPACDEERRLRQGKGLGRGRGC